MIRRNDAVLLMVRRPLRILNFGSDDMVIGGSVGGCSSGVFRLKKERDKFVSVGGDTGIGVGPWVCLDGVNSSHVSMCGVSLV